MVAKALEKAIKNAGSSVVLHEDWRLILGALLFASGCAFAFSTATARDIALLAGILSILLFAGGWLASARIKTILFLMAAFAAGVAVGDHQYGQLPQVRVERETFVSVSGTIESIEHRINAPLRLRISISKISKLPELIENTIQVTVRTNFPNTLAVGDAISFAAVLEPDGGPLVPGGFDFGQYLRLRDIAARGFAVSAIELNGLQDSSTSLGSRLANYRNQLSNRIMSKLDQPISGVAVALITGQRQYLDRSTANILRDAGLAHLLAISGLHMGLITGVAFFVLEVLLAAMPGIAVRIPARKLAALGAWLTAIAYLLLSGAGISTLRAFVMVSVALLAVVTDRRVISLRSVAFAAIAILLVSPQAILSISFQMSFAATIGLVVFYESLSRDRARDGHIGSSSELGQHLKKVGIFIVATALTSFVAQIAIAPIALFHFQALSLIGIIANILAVPVMAFIVMPAAFLALVFIPLGLDTMLLHVMGLGLEWIISLSTFLIEAPFSVLRAGPFHAGILLATFAMFGAVMLWKHRIMPAVVSIALTVTILTMQKNAASVLIDSEGRIIAAKTEDKRFAVIGGRRGGFRDEVWLRYWNFPLNAPNEKMERACNSRGCSTSLPSGTSWSPDMRIVRAFSLETVRKACNSGQIVIAPYDFRRHCRNAVVFLSIEDIIDAGPVGLYFEQGEAKKIRAEFSSPQNLFSNADNDASPD